MHLFMYYTLNNKLEQITTIIINNYDEIENTLSKTTFIF